MATNPPDPSTAPTHRGRLQAQGPNTEKSEAWAQTTPPTKADLLEMLDRLWAKLSQAEQADRAGCSADAKKYIQQAPANGIHAPFSKSFRNRKMKGGVRIDLEIRVGTACID